ncbi:MAG: hypothetical protein WD229_03150, partial [Pirellulales bacterium]
MRALLCKWQLFGAAALLLVLLPWLCMAIINQRAVLHYGPQIEFDPGNWARNREDDDGPTDRQKMVRDLVVRILPGKTRTGIEELLGPSPTHQEMRRHTQQDREVREKDENGNWKPYPRTGEGYYYDEFDWDLLYDIGFEQIFITDHRGLAFSPDDEVLLIRLDERDGFSSWYIDG